VKRQTFKAINTPLEQTIFIKFIKILKTY